VVTALSVVLEHAGYTLSTALEGRAGLHRAYEDHPDLVLLDVALPDLDGFTVLDRLHDLTDVPVIMLTARTQPADTVRGLDGGAADYINKPFDNEVLLAHIRAQMRQYRRRAARKNEYVVDEHLTVDFSAHRLIVDGVPTELTPTEWRILRRLMESEGQTVSTVELLQAAWGVDSSADQRQIKVRISSIRRKIGDGAYDSKYIHTDREIGYRFDPHRPPPLPPPPGASNRRIK
jgi:DNA-binding response OmpR family regulator